MKLAHLASFLALASAALADTAGSYATVTSTLTVTSSNIGLPSILANGNKETKATWSTYSITNAAIISECQRQGILTAGNISGWRLMAIFGRDNLAGFVITNGLETIWIPSVISVSRDEVTGSATKGRWVRNTSNKIVGGSTTYLDGFTLSVSIQGVTYVSTCIAQISDTVVSFGFLADPVWKPTSAVKINVAGLADPEDNPGLMRGALSISAPKSIYKLELALLGFDGFDALDTATD